MKKILILTAPFGAGHMQAANALVEQFEKNDYVVCKYDLVTEESPRMSRAMQLTYKQFYRRGARQIYAFTFKAADVMLKHKVRRPVILRGTKAALVKIDEFKPDAIIITYPFQSFQNALGKIHSDINVYSVVTDFYVHSTWAHKYASKYFLAHADVKNEFIRRFPKETNKVEVTGIPIRQQFSTANKHKGITKSTYNILFNAGASGVSQGHLSLFNMILMNNNFSLEVICGNNIKFESDCRKLEKLFPERIKVHNYVVKMAKIYERSDFVITKAGGITVSEVASLGVIPVFITGIGGQEEKNVDFFVSRNAGIRVKSKLEIIDEITHIINNEILYKKIVKNILEIGKVSAAANIFSVIDKEIREKN